MGFKFQIVLADSLYGESGDFIEALNHNQLKFIVAIRSNHSVLMPLSLASSIHHVEKVWPSLQGMEIHKSVISEK